MYNKQIILDYLVENNVKVSEHNDAKIFDSAETIKELLESNKIEKIDNNLFIFIKHEFHFGGNNIEVAKELLSIAKKQNNILPIKYMNTNGYIDCVIGVYIYNLIKQYILK